MEPLTKYLTSPAVQIFEHFVGDAFQTLDLVDLWDVAIVLAKSTLIIKSKSDATDIEKAIELSSIQPSDKACRVLKALNGFPSEQVRSLVIALLRMLSVQTAIEV